MIGRLGSAGPAGASSQLTRAIEHRKFKIAMAKPTFDERHQFWALCLKNGLITGEGYDRLYHLLEDEPEAEHESELHDESDRH